MKKIILILLLLCPLLLTSCARHHTSLEEYKTEVELFGIGYSQVELDLADTFLPSKTFLSDFAYTDGGFYCYESSVFLNDPETSFLHLTYDDDTYALAKQYTLDHIPAYGEKQYTYGNYVFYRNANFLTVHEEPDLFPHWFTMVGYNDQRSTLLFLGFYVQKPYLDEDFLNDPQSHWVEFIDTYYGDIYDFSE